MSIERFRRFEADGSGQQMMPLLITNQRATWPAFTGDQWHGHSSDPRAE